MKSLWALPLAFAAVLFVPETGVAALSFSTFVSGSNISSVLGQNATIGFAYAGNKFVGSVYFGPNNNQLYSTDLSGGSVAAFGPVIPNASGEIFVASSLGLGGFPSRDIYASQNNGIFHITNDGTSGSTFVSGLSGNVKGIVFDSVGSFGNQMIVTTDNGSVYRVNSAGVATLVGNIGAVSEGVDIAPLGFGAFGGQLIVASESSNAIFALSSAGAVNFVANVPGAEMISFVPGNLGSSGSSLEGFYAANYPVDVQKADAGQFSSYLNDAIVTDEFGHGVYDVHWNGSTFNVSAIGLFPNQPEDGIFVTAKIINPTPEPASLLLIAAGIAGIGAKRRFTKK